LNADVTVSHGGVTETIGNSSSINYTDLRWVHHDNVGYIFPENADITVKNQRQQGSWSLINGTGSASLVRVFVFNVVISHGSSPTEGQYQYIVAPDQTLEVFQQYAQNHGYVTVRNDNTVQAVRNNMIGKTGIVFHSAASVDLGNGLTVASDKPALVLIEQEGANYQISVADPKYTETATSVSLIFNKQLNGTNATHSGASTTVTVALPTGDYTGSSVTNLYTDVNYSAISQPESREDAIVVYPNPAKNQATVGFEAGKFSGLEIYNMEGIKLFRKPISPDDTKIEISLSACPAGNYIIKLTGNKNSVNKKLLIF
jgi:chondroitin AC lyase